MEVLKLSAKKSASSEALALLYQKFQPNPFNGRERLCPVGYFLGVFEASVFDSRLRINSIRSLQQGRGIGSAVLREILAAADAVGAEVELTPVPFGSRRLNKAALVAWYGRHGFQKTRYGYMVRPAR